MTASEESLTCFYCGHATQSGRSRCSCCGVLVANPGAGPTESTWADLCSCEFLALFSEESPLSQLQKDEELWPQFEGKYVRWAGGVLEVQRDESGAIRVDVRVQGDAPPLVLVVREDQAPSARSLAKGQVVAFSGRLVERGKEAGCFPLELHDGRIVGDLHTSTGFVTLCFHQAHDVLQQVVASTVDSSSAAADAIINRTFEHEGVKKVLNTASAWAAFLSAPTENPFWKNGLNARRVLWSGTLAPAPTSSSPAGHSAGILCFKHLPTTESHDVVLTLRKGGTTAIPTGTRVRYVGKLESPGGALTKWRVADGYLEEDAPAVVRALGETQYSILPVKDGVVPPRVAITCRSCNLTKTVFSGLVGSPLYCEVCGANWQLVAPEGAPAPTGEVRLGTYGGHLLGRSAVECPLCRSKASLLADAAGKPNECSACRFAWHVVAPEWAAPPAVPVRAQAQTDLKCPQCSKVRRIGAGLLPPICECGVQLDVHAHRASAGESDLIEAARAKQTRVGVAVVIGTGLLMTACIVATAVADHLDRQQRVRRDPQPPSEQGHPAELPKPAVEVPRASREEFMRAAKDAIDAASLARGDGPILDVSFSNMRHEAGAWVADVSFYTTREQLVNDTPQGQCGVVYRDGQVTLQ